MTKVKDGFYHGGILGGADNSYILLGGGGYIPKAEDGKVLSYSSTNGFEWKEDTNTDEKVIQYERTGNKSTYQLLFTYSESPNNTANYVGRNSGITVNPATATAYASYFQGWLKGNVTGNVTGNATTVSTIANNTSATFYPTFVDSNNASATAETIYTNKDLYISKANASYAMVLRHPATGVDGNSCSSRFIVSNSYNQIEMMTANEGGLYHRIKNNWIIAYSYANGSTFLSLGNVGIGTSSPTYKLQVNGTGYFGNILDIDRTAIGANAGGTKLNVLRTRMQNASGTNYAFKPIINIISEGETGSTVDQLDVEFGSQSGNTFITAGEGASRYPSICYLNNKGEDVIMVADQQIKFIVKAQSLTTSATTSYTLAASFNSNGHFIPGSNQTFNIGSSAFAWNNIYAYAIHIMDDGAHKHIEFSRSDNPNYIVAPSGGSIALNTTGNAALASTTLLVDSTSVHNGKTNTFDLGKTSDYWRTAYITTLYTGNTALQMMMGRSGWNYISIPNDSSTFAISYGTDSSALKALIAIDKTSMYPNFNNSLDLGKSANYYKAAYITNIYGTSFLGNAATATKLSTTRKIWGQEFDGTADVRNTLYVIDSAGNNTTASAKIKFNNLVDTDAYTKNSPYIQGVVDGITSTYGRKRLGFFVSNDAKYNGDYTEALSILPTANIGIGITNPSEKLDVNGNSYIRGSLYLDTQYHKTSYGIHFWNRTYNTWIEYMSNKANGPGGAAHPTGNIVTSWAMRSIIENAAGYGWIWESSANAANSAISNMMELSSNTGNLWVKGSITAPSFIGNATSASYLANRSLTAAQLDSQSGTFAFTSTDLINATSPYAMGTGFDDTGIQIGDSLDKFQITASGNTLWVRQNDSGGTNSTGWGGWKKLIPLTKIHWPGGTSPAVGWYRLCRIQGIGGEGYISGILFMTGYWSTGKPAQVIIHLAAQHNTPSITQISGMKGDVITKVRLLRDTSANAVYFVDVYQGCNYSSGNMSLQSFSLFGNFLIDQISNGIVATSDTGGTELELTTIATGRLISDGSHVLPMTANALDIGSVDYPWRNIQANTLILYTTVTHTGDPYLHDFGIAAREINKINATGSTPPKIKIWALYAYEGGTGKAGYMPICFGTSEPPNYALFYTGNKNYSGSTYSNYWGINIKDPLAVLHIGGTFRADGRITFTGLDNGSSIFTDGTELLTSWASDDGFAATDGPGIVHKRKASLMWNYIANKIKATTLKTGTTGTIPYYDTTTSISSSAITYDNGNITIPASKNINFASSSAASFTGIKFNWTSSAEQGIEWNYTPTSGWARALMIFKVKYDGASNFTNIATLGWHGGKTSTDGFGKFYFGDGGYNDSSAPFNIRIQKSPLNVWQLSTNHAGTSWRQGRDFTLITESRAAASGWHPLMSILTSTGSWDIGNYNYNTWKDALIFSYVTDTDYASGGSNRSKRTILYPADDFTERRFVTATAATVGSSSQPTYLYNGDIVACTNVSANNADMVDNYHAIGNTTGNIIKKGYINIGTTDEEKWYKIASIPGNSDSFNRYTLHLSTFYAPGSGTTQYSGIIRILRRSSSSYFYHTLQELTGDIPLDYVRLYYNTYTNDLELYYKFPTSTTSNRTVVTTVLDESKRSGQILDHIILVNNEKIEPTDGWSYVEMGRVGELVNNNFTSNGAYPVVWSNQAITSSVISNQFFKSHSYFMWNPGSKLLHLTGYMGIGINADASQGRLIFLYNNIALNFRPDNANYSSKVEYMTSGNEALVFANKNAITSFIFKCGTDLTDSSNWYSSVIGVPTVQMKNQSLYVNTAIATGTIPAYNLCVTGNSSIDGSLYATTFYGGTGANQFICGRAANWNYFVFPTEGAICFSHGTSAASANTVLAITKNTIYSNLTTNTVDLGLTSKYFRSAYITNIYGTSFSGNAATATTASKLAGGAANKITYQSAADTTKFIDAPSSNTYLKYDGSKFVWATVTNTDTLVNQYIRTGNTTYQLLFTYNSQSANATGQYAGFSTGLYYNPTTTTLTATYLNGIAYNIAGGGTCTIAYQSAPGITKFVSSPSSNTYLKYDGSKFVWATVTDTDTLVTQTYTSSSTTNYEVLLRNTSGTGTTSNTDTTRFSSLIYARPNGTLYAKTFSGALSGNATTATTGTKIKTNSIANSSTIYYILGQSTSDGWTGVSSANVYVGYPYFVGNDLYQGSDKNLKKDIKEISDEFTNSLFLSYYNIIKDFTWKKTNKPSTGFIAQELAYIVPDAVNYDQKSYTYSVNYNQALSKMVGALLKKVKEQDERISYLEYIISYIK